MINLAVPEWLISRTIERCRQLAGQTEGLTLGVKRSPLVEIDFDKVIPDTLHLKLRIRGKLLNQVLHIMIIA